MEQSTGLVASSDEYHKSRCIQSDINWSGFFGDSNDDVALNNDVCHREIFKGIYKGDCIKEKAILTPTQIFCADTTEVCYFISLRY